MDYTAQVNILQIPGAVRHTNQKTGREMVIIPLDSNALFVGEKGIYLDMRIAERKEPSYGKTHSIRLSVSKDAYKAMSEDQRKAIPYIGDMKPVQQTQQQTTQPTLQQAKETLQAAGFIEDANDDLPF